MEIQELLPIHSGEGTKHTVSAKTLYEFLGLDPTTWAKWYKRNILNNEFAFEHVDYEPLGIETSGKGNRVSQDFEITIDFAKKISMMARTEKGNEARKYFIECERKVLNPALSDSEIMSRALMIAHETLAAKDKVIEAKDQQMMLQEPVMENQRILTETDKVFTMTEGGATLGISAQRLKKLLIQTKFFKAADGLPYQKFLDGGYFQVKLIAVPIKKKFSKMIPQACVTGKGMILLTSWYRTLNHPMLKKKGLL